MKFLKQLENFNRKQSLMVNREDITPNTFYDSIKNMRCKIKEAIEDTGDYKLLGYNDVCKWLERANECYLCILEDCESGVWTKDYVIEKLDLAGIFIRRSIKSYESYIDDNDDNSIFEENENTWNEDIDFNHIEDRIRDAGREWVITEEERDSILNDIDMMKIYNEIGDTECILLRLMSIFNTITKLQRVY